MDIKLKTRFSVGDTAKKFNASTNKLEDFLVHSITVQVIGETTTIGYHTKESYSYTEEKNLFASKQEFINQL